MSPSTNATGPEPGSEGGARRRAMLYLAVGSAAGLAGAGAAWLKWAPGNDSSGTSENLWGLTFDTPTGSTLAMQTLRGRPLLINFWATWCPPCVEELPLLDAFFKQNSAKSWQVIGLAIDQPSAVRNFLLRTPVSFPVGMAGLGGTELAKGLGNSQGGLPFTVILGASGKILQRRIGRVTEADLAQWALLR
jgi:thiol-disulfide isomerase/thioredoxin